MLIMKPRPGIRVRKIYIPSGASGDVPALVLLPRRSFLPRLRACCGSTAADIASRMKEMVYISAQSSWVKSFGAVVVPRLPALHRFSLRSRRSTTAIRRWVYMKEHAAELGMRQNQLMVGGERAGGGPARRSALVGAGHWRGERRLSDAALPDA